MFWVTLLVYAAVFVLAELLRPKPKHEGARPANLGDFRFPTATEGRVVPIVWGTVKCEAPNVVWYGDLRQVAITKKVKTGLFSSSRVTTGFRYYVGIQMAICRGPIDQLRRIWVGDDVVFDTVQTSEGTFFIDKPELFGGDELGSGGIQGTVALYMGSETQNADSYLSQFQVPCPGYRGTAYVVARQMYVGNSTNIAPWAFEVRRIPNGLGLSVPGVNDGADANIMNVIYEIMTNTDWGLGLPPGDIDVANFTAAANTLREEGNGFSFILDNALDARELLEELQRQMDGVVYLDPSSGKWKVILARGGYTIGTLPQLDESNVLEIKDFTRGAWEDTTNQVRVEFTDRDRNYFETSAFAQDLGNQRTQGNLNVFTSMRFPGVKTANNANNIAWRTLRALSFPLAKATLVVNRKAWNLVPGMVFAWTDSTLGINQMPMRVSTIDYGTHRDGTIEITAVQDVFAFTGGVFNAPPPSGWQPPTDTIVPIPAADSKVFEAPYALCRRDPERPGVIDRVWCGGRYQNDRATVINLLQRTSAGTPSGAYTQAGEAYGFALVGELAADLSAGTVQGVNGIVVNPSPDLLSAGGLVDSTPDEVGSDLVNLMMIDDEIIACTTRTIGAAVTLNGVYRGLCDTAPANHAAGSKVWLLRGALMTTQFPRGNNVHVKLQPRSRSDTLNESAAPQIALTMSDRARRPYAVVELTENGTRYPTGTVSLDANGSGLDDRGILQGFRRRDYRTYDEVVGVLNDAASIAADFPAANSTEYAIEVRNDPNGANTLLFTTPYSSSNSVLLNRTRILRYTNAVVPTRLRVIVKARHTFNGEVFDGAQHSQWDFNVASAQLAGLFSLGTRAANEATAPYTAPTSGSYAVSIGTAMGGGNVEYRINGGAWTTVIPGGSTSGSIPGVVAGDILEFRNTWSGPGTGETMLFVNAPASSSDAFGIFIQ